MPMIEIDEDELNATRSQAASAMPWKNEAHRLAKALLEADPEHRLLRGEIWARMKKEREAERRGEAGYKSENGVMGAALSGVRKEDIPASAGSSDLGTLLDVDQTKRVSG